MAKRNFSITVKRQDKCLIYTESNAQYDSSRMYSDDNSIVFEIWVEQFDYEFTVRDGCAFITAKEREEWMKKGTGKEREE